MSVASVHVDPDWAQRRPHVRGMLGGRLANGADAEDVVQEVLLRVFRGTSQLRDSDRFGSWLAATVRNSVADQLRARQRHPVVPAADQAPVDSAGEREEPDDAARRALAGILRPFAERLPAIYREVITLSELDELPHAEIARRLSISVSGVKSRVQRGREQLHKMLTDCCNISLDARGGIVDCVPRDPASAPDCCAPPPSTTGFPPTNG